MSLQIEAGFAMQNLIDVQGSVKRTWVDSFALSTHDTKLGSPGWDCFLRTQFMYQFHSKTGRGDLGNYGGEKDAIRSGQKLTIFKTNNHPNQREKAWQASFTSTWPSHGPSLISASSPLHHAILALLFGMQEVLSLIETGGKLLWLLLESGGGRAVTFLYNCAQSSLKVCSVNCQHPPFGFQLAKSQRPQFVVQHLAEFGWLQFPTCSIDQPVRPIVAFCAAAVFPAVAFVHAWVFQECAILVIGLWECILLCWPRTRHERIVGWLMSTFELTGKQRCPTLKSKVDFGGSSLAPINQDLGPMALKGRIFQALRVAHSAIILPVRPYGRL